MDPITEALRAVFLGALLTWISIGFGAFLVWWLRK